MWGVSDGVQGGGWAGEAAGRFRWGERVFITREALRGFLPVRVY